MSAGGQDVFQDGSPRPESLRKKVTSSLCDETSLSLNIPACFKYASRKLQCVFPSYFIDSHENVAGRKWQISGRFKEST